MRKTSQDGGDSTSITSGIENDIKKCGPAILKTTKNSIKRKVQNLSSESDDMANEPLLHRNKEKSEIEKQSAKFLISKTKTDFASEKGNDKDKLLADEKITRPSITDVTGITDSPIGIGMKDQNHVTSQSISTASIYNHMNTNVFKSTDTPKDAAIAKTQILIELDTTKSTRYSPSPLIFTTAKIHTDGKNPQMEPVQVTPVPILSTIEGGLVKTGIKTTEIYLQQSKENKNIAVISPVTRVATISNLPEKHDITVTSNESVSVNASIKSTPFGSSLTDNKDKINPPTQNGSAVSAHMSNSKVMTENSLRTKHSQPLCNVRGKLVETTTRVQDLQDVSRSHDFSSSVKKDFTKTPGLAQVSSAADKNYVDVNKNFQSPPKLNFETKVSDKKIDYKTVSSVPISNVSGIKELSPGSSAKADKTVTDSVSNKEEFKSSYNSQESTMTISKIKSPVTDQTVNITTTVSTSSSTAKCADKVKTVKSTDNSVYKTGSSVLVNSMPNTTKFSVNKPPVKEHTANTTKPSTNEALSTRRSSPFETDSSLPVTLTASTTKSNINKSSDKEHVINFVTTVSSTKPGEMTSKNKVNTVDPPGSGILKTETLLLETSLPSTTKSIGQDKESSVLTSKPTAKGTTTQKLPSNSKIPSIMSGTPATGPTSTKLSESVSPQVTSSIKTAPIVIKTTSTTNTMKTSTATPTTSINKTSVKSGISTPTGTALSTLSSTVLTTADDVGVKYKSNNVATVVSSISKTTTTSSSTKFTSPGSSSTTMTKSSSSVKQSTSPSTVKTISSIPTVKSTIVSTVPHEKKSIKDASTSVTDPMSSVSNTKSIISTTKKPLTAKETSTVTVTPSAKVVATSLTKPVAKSSTQGEVKPNKDVKDIKGSKA